MNVLIINPIPYTSETKEIRRANSIKDTMIHGLCAAFQKCGHSVTLFAAEPFKPLQEEEYPFSVIWAGCALKKVCMCHCFPFMPEVWRYIVKNRKNIDLIISSEVFSLNSLGAALLANDKLIVWHELAKHNAMLKKIPSRFWYNIVARLFMRKTCVVARSAEARNFISRFCANTQPQINEHGVDLDKFRACEEKDDSFVVCSQLIDRKRIDGIIDRFGRYLREYNAASRLYIIGDGPLKERLKKLVESSGLQNSVFFLGKMTHDELLPYLSRAKALLINTEKDNSMISIIEAIAVATPVVTTRVPLNASYIEEYDLGIVGDWTAADLASVSGNCAKYVSNCMQYRRRLSNEAKVAQFLQIHANRMTKME